MQKNEVVAKAAPRKVNRWHKMATYIPEDIHAILVSILSVDNYEYDRGVKLISRILNTYDKRNLSYTTSIHIPNTYIKKVVSGHGGGIWKKIIDSKIILKTRNYSTSNRKCYAYKFNEDYIASQNVRVEFRQTNKISSTFENSCIELHKRHISLDIPSSIEDLVFSRRDYFEDDTKSRIRNKRYYPKKGRSTYIKGAIEDFVTRKVHSRCGKDLRLLSTIIEGNWRASRNNTNNRLDTNLTNLSGFYKNFLRIDGQEAISLDLRNSQFTIFANLMSQYFDQGSAASNFPILGSSFVGDFIGYCKMSPLSQPSADLISFIKHCLNGTLYEDIQSNLQLPSRDDSKKYAFKLFFGTSLYDDDELKGKIREVYPSVVELIDGYKTYCYERDFKEYKKDPYGFRNRNYDMHPRRLSYRKFSIMLQSIEAEIFIDRIYINMIDCGYLLFPIHDSFLFKDPALVDVIKYELGNYLTHGFVTGK